MKYVVNISTVDIGFSNVVDKILTDLDTKLKVVNSFEEVKKIIKDIVKSSVLWYDELDKIDRTLIQIDDEYYNYKVTSLTYDCIVKILEEKLNLNKTVKFKASENSLNSMFFDDDNYNDEYHNEERQDYDMDMDDNMFISDITEISIYKLEV